VETTTESTTLIGPGGAKATVSNKEAAKTLASGATAAAKKEASKAWIFLTQGPQVLKVYCFAACAACLVVGIIQMIGNILNPFHLIVSFYATFFAGVGMALEGTGLCCNRHCKTRVEHWTKIFARVWGRGILYLLISGMQFAQGGWEAYLVGIAMVLAAVFSFCLSFYASRKLRSMHTKMLSEYTASTDPAAVRDAFNRMDADNSGTLEKEELAVLCRQLGVDVNPNELVAIFDMLDSDSNGKVSFDEFLALFGKGAKAGAKAGPKAGPKARASKAGAKAGAAGTSAKRRKA